MGGETSGTNVSKSKRPVLDWAFSSQYRFSKSMMSDSSTAVRQTEFCGRLEQERGELLLSAQLHLTARE